MKKKIMILGFLATCSLQAALNSSGEELNAPILNISPEDAALLLEALPVEEVVVGGLTAEEAELPMHALPFFEQGAHTSIAEEFALPVEVTPVGELSPEEANLPMKALPIEEEIDEAALPITALPVEVIPAPTISIDGDVIKSISVPVSGPQVQADTNTVRFIDGHAHINTSPIKRSLK